MSLWSLLTLALCAWVLWSTSATFAFHFEKSQDQEQPVQGDYQRPGLSAADILRGRGYLAKEFFIYTRDGYKINIVRGRNPLINGGKSGLAGTLPILFVHGTVDAAPTLLSTTTRARPRNFSRHLKRLKRVKSGEQLMKMLNGDPSTANAAFLALNFGYEIWLVNRRGFNRSKGRRGHENRTLTDAILSIPGTFLAGGQHPEWLSKERPNAEADDSPDEEHEKHYETSTITTTTTAKPKDRDTQAAWAFWRDLFKEHLSFKNLPKALTNFGKFKEQFIQTFDPEYWDFSLDEQAEHDIPDAIQFVVDQTGCSRVHTVGLSSGGALILLATAAKPQLASKIASATMWAPSLNMGSAKDIVFELSRLIPIVQSYIGPLPFVFNQQQIAGLIQEMCNTDHMQRNFCSRLLDIVFGYSGTQGPLHAAILANLLEPTSFHELAQLGQFAHTSQPCKFKFNNPKKNLERYGQLEPPCYDLGRVEIGFLTIYGGQEDLLVSPGDLNTTISQLTSAPVKLKIVNQSGIFFNHGGAIIHEQADRFVQSPTFLDIWRAESSHELADEAAKCHVKRGRARGSKSREEKMEDFLESHQ